MPENEGYAAGGYMFKVLDNGERENLGYISGDGITLTTEDDELDRYAVALLKRPACTSFELNAPWCMLNRLLEILAGKPKRTVGRLRRDRKGHPRCRRRNK